MEIFGFNQQDLCNEDISLSQALLLKYLIANEGYELTISRILIDLPILTIERRQLMRMIDILCDKKIISKIKTKYGFIFQRCQKCHLLISRGVKNVTSKNDCNRITINNNYNNNKDSHNEIYLKPSERDLFIKSFNDKYISNSAKKLKYMDIGLLVNSIKQSKFLCDRPYLDYNWCIKNYERIVSGAFRDVKNSKIEKGVSRHYTEEELSAMFTDLDNVVI